MATITMSNCDNTSTALMAQSVIVDFWNATKDKKYAAELMEFRKPDMDVLNRLSKKKVKYNELGLGGKAPSDIVRYFAFLSITAEMVEKNAGSVDKAFSRLGKGDPDITKAYKLNKIGILEAVLMLLSTGPAKPPAEMVKLKKAVGSAIKDLRKGH